MSFADLDRGLTTPPISPNSRGEELLNINPHLSYIRTTPTTTTTTTTTRITSSASEIYDNKNTAVQSAVSPPTRLQVTRGNSRDIVGVDLQGPLPSRMPFPLIKDHHQTRPHSHLQSPYPPPVSPKRNSTNNPMAQHSRFLNDNTRFDTPRPTLTPSSAIETTSGATVGGIAATAMVATPRAPHAIFTPNQSGNDGGGNGNNRILGDHGPGDQERRQALSPPTSPPQLFPSLNPLRQNYRGFIRDDDRMTSDSGVNNPSSRRDPDTVINVDTNNHIVRSSPSTAAYDSTPTSALSSTSAPWDSIESQEHDYDLMVRHVSQQIFNISSNIAVVERLVPCLGQRHKDTPEMRASLHAVLDGTQDLVKSAHNLIKVLTKYHQPTPISLPSNVGIRMQTASSQNEMSSWQKKLLASRRLTHQRLTKDLALASRSFQELQRQAVEAERKQVATLRRLSGSASLRRLSQRRSDLMDLSQKEIESEAILSSYGKGGGSSGYGSFGGVGINGNANHDRKLSVQEESLLREILAVDGELVFQEAILQERETEILKMEEGLSQVLDIMRELGALVHTQRGEFDFLHDNILQTRGRTQIAYQDVLTSSEYQRKSREKLCYLIMIASTVGALVMFAFVSM